MKLTILQAKAVADKAEKLFERAAQAWVTGNNSGSSQILERKNALCEKLRNEAERLLMPFGIKIDYPGLYPSFEVNGHHEYTVLSALSAALEMETA